jgi:hypothetical protein
MITLFYTLKATLLPSNFEIRLFDFILNNNIFNASPYHIRTDSEFFFQGEFSDEQISLIRLTFPELSMARNVSLGVLDRHPVSLD